MVIRYPRRVFARRLRGNMLSATVSGGVLHQQAVKRAGLAFGVFDERLKGISARQGSA
jgi:hypothetical protein